MPPQIKDKPRSPWGTVAADEERQQAPAPRKSRVGWWVAGFLLALAVAGVVVAATFSKKPVTASAAIEFTPPPDVFLGEPFTLPLSVSNYSDFVFANAKLSLFLPDDVAFLGGLGGQRVVEQQLGNLGPGSVNQQSFNLIATGDPQSLRRISAKFTYTISPDEKTQFERGSAVDVLIGQPALQISFDSPKNVLNGQDFTVKMHYQNFSKQDLRNVRLQVSYPPIFQFRKASTDPDVPGGGTWTFRTLKGNDGGDIVIAGSVVGPEGTFFTIQGNITADFLGQTYTLADQSASIGISSAPLSVKVTVNGGENVIAHIGDTLNYTISYKNNANIPFQDIVVTARLIGTLFDYSTLSTNASFNSLTNTLSWIAANAPELQNLPPGEERSLTFQARLKKDFPIKRVSDKNYAIRVSAQIESPTIPPDTVAEKTVSLASVETKVAGILRIDEKGLWRDAASGFLNSGPYPPRVNQTTQYTVHWTLTNFATDVEKVHIEAYLQSGARFTGKVESNVSTTPSVNAATGLVTWDIPNIVATKGVISAPVEAVFQIEATPAVNQVGQNIPLLSETRMTAQDSFTGIALQDSAPALNSSLPDDTSISTPDRAVRQ